MERNGEKSTWSRPAEFVAFADLVIGGFLFVIASVAAVVLPLTPAIQVETNLPFIVLVLLSSLLASCSIIFLVIFGFGARLLMASRQGPNLKLVLYEAKLWQSFNAIVIVLLLFAVCLLNSMEDLVDDDTKVGVIAALFLRLIASFVVQLFIADVKDVIKMRAEQAMEMV